MELYVNPPSGVEATNSCRTTSEKKSVKKKEREQIPFMIQMIIDHQLKQEGNLKKENASFVSYIL